MGAIYETDTMLRHVEQCGQCKAASNFADRCDAWGDMYQNVVDFECGEGPWEDKPEGWLMCDECDGPIEPNAGRCEACGYQWCIEDVHTSSSSDCDEIEVCGKPAVETVGGRPCCEEHKL